MTLHRGDCLDVMAQMPAASIDAIVTDPPYDLTARPPGPNSPVMQGVGRGFMGKSWDGTGIAFDPGTWALALAVAKPGAYLLAFGGTRTYHRMTVAIEDAGWMIRDCVVWAYASGFPKSRALLKPAWEPIVMARKAGPLRELAIDDCRIAFASDEDEGEAKGKNQHSGYANPGSNRDSYSGHMPPRQDYDPAGRWPANVVLTDPVFGDVASRFFLIPKADRAEREPVFGERRNFHPTVKPVDLMRHLVRLVTPRGGTVLDPFLGSGTTAIAAEMEGFAWIGIEREADYVATAEARLQGVQRGMGLPA